MKWLCAIFLVLLCGTSFGQKSGAITFYSKCPQLNYCKDCGDTKAAFPGKLKKAFEKELNFRDLERIEGVVILKVVVDSLGNACVDRLYNRSTNSSEEIRLLQLENVFARSMPKWKPAILGGKAVNSYVLLAMYSHIDGHGLFDINYLRNDKQRKWVLSNSNNQKVMMYFDSNAEMTE